MSCNGFPADTYDRYVLGLLDEHERSHIESQIEQQCPLCLRGVQRSMNLWLVFATTLEDAEPSADFRARLVRIADLSKRVLTLPKRHRSLTEPRILVSGFVAVCFAIGILMVLTWFGGRFSARTDASRLSAEFEQLERENTRNRLDLEQERSHSLAIEKKLTVKGDAAGAQDQKKLENLLSKTQAEVEQYKSIFTREGQLRSDNSRILDTLGLAGAKLLQLKSMEASASSDPPVGYAIVVENSRLIFIGSNLPKPAPELQLQVWLLRKEEPRVVNAGLVSIDEKKRGVTYYDEDAANISGILGIEVTEEPFGSQEPSGPKILESANVPAAESRLAEPVFQLNLRLGARIPVLHNYRSVE